MLIVIFPPLVKNVLTADERVASLTIAVFSVGVAIGSMIINQMLKGKVSAKYSPASVIAMGAVVVALAAEAWFWVPAAPDTLYGFGDFIVQPQAWLLLATLLAIAVTGGMFVVPLYAFLTTTVTKDQTARTVAANNIVNAGAMTIGAVTVTIISTMGVGPTALLLLVAGMCLISAWIAQKLHLACD